MERCRALRSYGYKTRYGTSNRHQIDISEQNKVHIQMNGIHGRNAYVALFACGWFEGTARMVTMAGVQRRRKRDELLDHVDALQVGTQNPLANCSPSVMRRPCLSSYNHSPPTRMTAVARVSCRRRRLSIASPRHRVQQLTMTDVS